jgi:uncharacterized membrane protein YhhN
MAGIGIVFVGFLLHWVAIVLKWERIKPYTKALGLILLIGWTLFVVDFQSPWMAILLIAGLAFGLTGDIFLALSEKWFTMGLGAFLLGHLVYLSLIVLTLTRAHRLDLLGAISGWSIVPLAAAILAALLVFNRVIVRPLQKKNPDKAFIAALYFYAVCLTSVMVFSGFTAFLLSDLSWKVWALALGGALFFISDFILAYDRFVRRVKLGQLWVMVTYYLAQFCLAYGFIVIIDLIA